MVLNPKANSLANLGLPSKAFRVGLNLMNSLNSLYKGLPVDIIILWEITEPSGYREINIEYRDNTSIVDKPSFSEREGEAL